jgi:hypothetical protein
MRPLPAWLVPQIGWLALRQALVHGFLAALVAGTFGMVHDAITYRLGPDYFHEFKFPQITSQFPWADFGLPRSLFAMEIGFLASWWVGAVGGYLLSRKLQHTKQIRQFWPQLRRILAIAAFTAITVGICGACFATDAIQQVAWIHNSTYAGATVAWIWTMLAKPRSA